MGTADLYRYSSPGCDCCMCEIIKMRMRGEPLAPAPAPPPAVRTFKVPPVDSETRKRLTHELEYITSTGIVWGVE